MLSEFVRPKALENRIVTPREESLLFLGAGVDGSISRRWDPPLNASSTDRIKTP